MISKIWRMVNRYRPRQAGGPYLRSPPSLSSRIRSTISARTEAERRGHLQNGQSRQTTTDEHGILGAQSTHLYVGFTSKTNYHKQQNGNNVVVEAGPIVDLESSHERTYQHEENRAWS